MSRLTPDEVATKQATRLKGALQDVRTGIERVTASPMAAAVQKEAKLKLKVNEAIDSGKWKKNTAAVTLDQWKTAAINKGVNNIPTGIDAAHDKQVQFYGKLLPAIDAARAKVNALPDNTLEDGINRMTTMIREMAKFRKA